MAFDNVLADGCDAWPALSFARRAALFDTLYMRLYHTVRPPLFDDANLRRLAELRATTKPPVLSKADETAMEAERTWRFGKEALLDRIAQRSVQHYAEAVATAHATRSGRVACRASLRRLATYRYVLGDTKLGLFMVDAYRSGMFVRLRPQPVPASTDPRAAIAQNALDVGEPERAFPIYQLVVRQHADDQTAKAGLAEAERALGRTNDPLMQHNADDERAIALDIASRADLDLLLAD